SSAGSIDVGAASGTVHAIGHPFNNLVRNPLADGDGHLLTNGFLHVGRARDLLAHAAFLPNLAAADAIGLFAGALYPLHLRLAHTAAAGIEAAVATLGAASRAAAAAARTAVRTAVIAADALPAGPALARHAVLLGDPLAALLLHRLHGAARLADR